MTRTSAQEPDYQMFAPIMKVDTEQRMVFGYASTECEDRQGEIVRHSAVKAALPGYMLWKNVREMHQPSAVGKAVEAEMDDKGLWFGAHIVDDRAWEKVLKKVYQGFSIGGRVTARDPNNKKIVTGVDITEISIVDRPANPESTFAFAKRAGDHLLMQPVQKWDCGHPDHQHITKMEAATCMADHQELMKASFERAEDIDTLAKYNKNHHPKGAPGGKGGEFAPKDGGDGYENHTLSEEDSARMARDVSETKEQAEQHEAKRDRHSKRRDEYAGGSGPGDDQEAKASDAHERASWWHERAAYAYQKASESFERGKTKAGERFRERAERFADTADERSDEAWALEKSELTGDLAKYNKNHHPAGSSKGGQFAPGDDEDSRAADAAAREASADDADERAADLAAARAHVDEAEDRKRDTSDRADKDFAYHEGQEAKHLEAASKETDKAKRDRHNAAADAHAEAKNHYEAASKHRKGQKLGHAAGEADAGNAKGAAANKLSEAIEKGDAAGWVLAKRDWVLAKANPNHHPKGTPGGKGGQFAPKTGGEGGFADHQEAVRQLNAKSRAARAAKGRDDRLRTPDDDLPEKPRDERQEAERSRVRDNLMAAIRESAEKTLKDPKASAESKADARGYLKPSSTYLIKDHDYDNDPVFNHRTIAPAFSVLRGTWPKDTPARVSGQNVRAIHTKGGKTAFISESDWDAGERYSPAMSKAEQILARADRLRKYNPNHHPAGSPKGGQFAPADGRGSGGDGAVPPDVTKTYNELKRELKKVPGTMNGMWAGSADGEKLEPNFYGQPGHTFSMRDVGQWVVPDGEEDDGDYDWKVPTDKTAAAIDAAIGRVKAANPGTDIKWSTEEKNYISLVITGKSAGAAEAAPKESKTKASSAAAAAPKARTKAKSAPAASRRTSGDDMSNPYTPGTAQHKAFKATMEKADAATKLSAISARIDELRKYNKNHHPAGSPGGIGGQFAPADGRGSGGESTAPIPAAVHGVRDAILHEMRRVPGSPDQPELWQAAANLQDAKQDIRYNKQAIDRMESRVDELRRIAYGSTELHQWKQGEYSFGTRGAGIWADGKPSAATVAQVAARVAVVQSRFPRYDISYKAGESDYFEFKVKDRSTRNQPPTPQVQGATSTNGSISIPIDPARYPALAREAFRARTRNRD